MTIRVDNFHGIQPRLHPTLLADGMAVTAHNCRLKNGKLVPLKEPSMEKEARCLFQNGLAKVADWMADAYDIRGEADDGKYRRLRDGKADLGCYQCWDDFIGTCIFVR